jgi:hypothetical protein
MKYAVLVFLMIGTAVNAESSSLNLALPSTPGNYQSDKFRAGELDCSNAIGSATNLEFGVTGIIANGDYTAMNEYINGPKTGDVGVYDTSRRMKDMQLEVDNRVRAMEVLNRDSEKDVRDTMRDVETRIEDKMRTLDTDLRKTLQEALDNPLAKK